MISTGAVVRADALRIPLRDATVDLIVTSPPYFALRSYRDGDAHYANQLGSEPTPPEFLEALWAATTEMIRVLKPSGSIWVNLGDKYAGSGGHNNNGLGSSTLKHDGRKNPKPLGEYEAGVKAQRRNAPDRYNQNSGGIPAKSLMGLPWRYAIGCIDQLGLILRAEVIWSKPNGLPESVTDRVRRSHEQWFHFTRQGRYFSAVDEVREAHNDKAPMDRFAKNPGRDGGHCDNKWTTSEDDGVRGYVVGLRVGKLPSSVWTVPSEPLIIPEAIQAHYHLPDHFAAFPQEWPRRIILGWSPSGVCTRCGEGRRPVVAKEANGAPHGQTEADKFQRARSAISGGQPTATDVTYGILGYACACTPHTDHPERRGKDWRTYRAEHEGGRPTTPERPSGPRNPGGIREYHLAGWTPPPTRPAVILDPFGGTGTVAMVARTLGRTGITIDLSNDYCRLARWRIHHSRHAAKTEQRTWADQQGVLFA